MHVFKLVCDIQVLTDPALDVNFSEDESGNTLQRLRDNVDLNCGIIGDRASAQKLVWGREGDMAALEEANSDFDLILGCDLLYNPDSYAALVQTMRRFSRGGAPILLAYPPRLPDELIFFNMAREHFDVHTSPLLAGHDQILAECYIKA